MGVPDFQTNSNHKAFNGENQNQLKTFGKAKQMLEMWILKWQNNLQIAAVSECLALPSSFIKRGLLEKWSVYILLFFFAN